MTAEPVNHFAGQRQGQGQDVPTALADIQRACDLISGHAWLRHASLDEIPGDSLEGFIAEVMAARALLGEFEDCVAFQLAASELPDSGAQKLERGAWRSSELMDSLQPPEGKPTDAETDAELGVVIGPEPAAHSVGEAPEEPQADAMAYLEAGYLSLYRKLRNRGQENESDRAHRDDWFAKFDRLVAEMTHDDRAYFMRLEADYAARAQRVHEQANAMSQFWGLPDIPSPATSRVPVLA